MTEENAELRAGNNEIANNDVAPSRNIKTILNAEQEVPDHLLRPLSKEELALDNTHKTKNKDELTVIAPVPLDAPVFTEDTPDYHNKKFGSKPSCIFKYSNEKGELMGHMARWDDVLQPDGTTKKETRPYTFAKDKNDKRFWCSKGLPIIPLYNLPQIVTRPNAPILVVEGEKTADAAKALFPDWVVTTSMFGAQAPQKTDWSYVKGREVIICPDFDDAGYKYGDAVYALARKASCKSIHLLDIKKLVKATLGKELDAINDQGYDFADAVADGLTPGLLNSKLESCLSGYFTQAQIKLRSLPKGFNLNENNQIEYEVMVKTPEITKVSEWRWLSSYIMITHQMRNEKSNGWSRIAEVIDSSHKHKEIIIPMTLLAGDGTELRKLLLDEGVILSTAKESKEKLLTYINLSFPRKLILFVQKIGWHKSYYILPNKVYGTQTAEQIRLNLSGKSPEFEQKGTIEEWNEHIGKYAIDNSRVQIAILIALAAPLLTPLGKENFGVHLVGASSTGKSTALRVACSVYGSEFRSWRTTDNSAESWGTSSNDNLLALDDMGQASAEAVSEMAYMLGNGQGKGRSNRKGVARDVAKFNICFLSTGEIGIAAKLQESKTKKSYHAGQAVRLLEISADAEKELGIFEELHGFTDGSELSKYFKGACQRYHGSLGDKWLTYLSENDGEALKLVKRFESKAIESMKIETKACGQVSRARGHFALMAAVGEVAIHEGFLGWPKDTAINTCAKLLNSWILSRGGAEAHEDIQILKDTKVFLQQDGNARFEIINKVHNSESDDAAPDTQKTVYKQAGFKENINNKWVYFIFPYVFQDEVIKSRNKNASLKILVENDFLEKDKEQFATLKHLPGLGSKRVYKMCLPADI